MKDLIKLSIQVEMETTPSGQRRAKLVKLLNPIWNSCSVSEISLTAHQFGEESNGWRPAINHTELLRITLFWVPAYPDAETFAEIESRIWYQVKKLVLGNEALWTNMLNLLDGTGWYLHTDPIK